MKKSPVPAETSDTPNVDLSSINCNVWDLYQLLDATHCLLLEMPFERDGARDKELDRVSALVVIARDHAERTYRAIEDNFYAIQNGSRG